MNGAEAKPLVPGALEIDHPLILQCERRIMAIKRSQAEGGVESAIEVGGLLRRVKSSLKRGLWGRWLHDHVGYSHRSAVRHMMISSFAESNWKSLAKFKSLGPNKLYALAQLSPHARDRLQAQDLHQIGHNGPRKTLAQMSLVEFNALARSLDGNRRHRSPALQELLRQGVGALERLCHVLRELKGRRLPEGPRSDRFRDLLRQFLELAAQSADGVAVPAHSRHSVDN